MYGTAIMCVTHPVCGPASMELVGILCSSTLAFLSKGLAAYITYVTDSGKHSRVQSVKTALGGSQLNF